MIDCSIEDLVPVEAVTQQQATPSIGSSSAKGDFEREEERKDFRVDDASSSTPKAESDFKHVIEEQPLEDKLPSVVNDVGRDTLAKETKSK